MKGGLRWPLGQETSGGRFTVVKTWHTNAKIFQSSSMRLKVRDADRFDFLTSVGEVAREVSLKMTEISEPLVSFLCKLDGSAKSVLAFLCKPFSLCSYIVF